MDIPKNWTFENKGIAEAFDTHVREQLPWYDLASCAIAHIARHYIPRNGLIYDIGASTGNIGRAMADTIDNRHAKLIPIEASEEMAAMYTGPQKGHLIRGDALSVEYEPFDLAICFLVLMFMPISERSAFIERLRGLLRPGGAIVLFDKCEPAMGYPATILWRLALAGKVASKVPADDIIDKELSLSGIQRPLAADEIPAGAVEWFRFGDLAGWLIEK